MIRQVASSKEYSDGNAYLVSVVIPCYNEAANIPELFRRISAVDKDGIEFIVVENGSTDDSRDVIESLLPKYQFIKTVIVQENKGYGFGIKEGLSSCSGAYIGWTHADLQTDINDVATARELIKRNSCKALFVKGERKGRLMFDKIFSVGMQILASLKLNKRFNDINAQPTLFSRELLPQDMGELPNDFSLDLYIYNRALIQDFQVERFKVNFGKRLYGSSSWGSSLRGRIRMIKRTAEYIIRHK